MAGEILMAIGGILAIIAGVGVLRFNTTYARLHAAGKASPVAFLAASCGAALHVTPAAGAYLLIAAVATVLTLPTGVHLLFRAVHRTSNNEHLVVDERTF